MYMKNSILLFITTILLFGSCKPDLSNPEVEKLYTEVMVIHDDVMPEISTIHKLKKKIKKADQDNADRLDILKDLEDADEGMMQWMADFGVFKKMDKEPSDVKIEFLKKEKEKITAVSKMMRKAIADGNQFLEDQNK